MRRLLHIFCTALLCLLSLVSCDKDGADTSVTVDYTIAVIMPLDNTTNWTGIADWFQENLAKAQSGLQRRIRLNIEWIDENGLTEDELMQTGRQLAEREDVMAVIGPELSKDVRIVAQCLSRTGKMMISPSATSAELLRQYSGKGFFWAMCESDITECEVLLTKAKSYGAKTVSLVADESDYGSTFRDWFAFQAEEMGMEALGLHHIAEIGEAVAEQPDYIICVPDKVSDVVDMLAAGKAAGTQPHFLFSGLALDPALLNYAGKVDMIEGTAPYADPATGFSIAYNIHFNAYSAMGGAQFYDALLLSALALQECDRRMSEDVMPEDMEINALMNDCLKSLMVINAADGSELPVVSAWNVDGLRLVMHNPLQYNISGASGSLDFDVSAQSSVLRSVYCHWLVYRNKMIPVDYLATDGSRNTSSIAADWEWHAKVMQEIGDVDAGIDYAALHSQWAVLVCGSEGWTNYRHQSDVLNMYNLLKANGFADDHIILIADPEDIAYHSSNIYPGTIRSTLGGPNLYNNPEVDYLPQEITAEDICSILRGGKSDALPVVLDTDEHSNILLYWSGHGEMGSFRWDGKGDDLSSGMLRDAVSSMSDGKRFRKFLLCCEPCYSGSVLKDLDGIPGVLGIASANSKESSFADIFDTYLSVWLSDRFSNRLIDAVRTNPDQSFWNLYLDLVHNTSGSHVTIVNYPFFDNLHSATPREFFCLK